LDQGNELGAIRRRLDRAEQLRDDINAALHVWRNRNPNPWTGHTNPERTEHHFHLTFNTPPDPIRWGLLFGDAIHNLRAALDNAIWAAAVRDCGDEEPLRRTQFPIFLDKDEFFGRVKGRRSGQSQIDSVKDADVRAIVERAQPWQRSDRPDFDHLWVVHEFDREDKHRVITPILIVPRQLNTAIQVRYIDEEVAASALPPVLEAKNQPLVDGAEFLTVYTPTPPVEVKMQNRFEFGIGVALDDQVGGITGTLGELCKHVRGIVEEILNCLA
jgi:hypothetical protein